MMKRYTLSELNAMPTIGNGHTENLKLEQDGVRVWLSRLDKSDGMPYDNQVTVEKKVDGQWTNIDTYEAK